MDISQRERSPKAQDGTMSSKILMPHLGLESVRSYNIEPQARKWKDPS